ncbi:hypothetical protein D3C73_1385410 [compost metagenome]
MELYAEENSDGTKQINRNNYRIPFHIVHMLTDNAGQQRSATEEDEYVEPDQNTECDIICHSVL